jgi:hypothetical protein
MDQLSKKGLSLSECVASYDLYAREVRCLAASTREIQRRILRRLCSFCFGDRPVAWDAATRHRRRETMPSEQLT